jgi:hypothetical protein
MNIEQVAEQFGIDSEDTSDVLSTLAVQAYERYEGSNSESDIGVAVALAKAAIRETCDDDPSLTSRLNKPRGYA